jgi:hypothetical protein
MLVSLHGGPRAVEALVARQFWILSARSVIRSEILNCVVCSCYRGKTIQLIMADLPLLRVVPQRPFSCVGVDYGGPFSYKLSNRRNSAIGKAYLCLFICFGAKAVHFELVTSLSTPAFIAAFQRFIARRGIPRTIYSDCGTNLSGLTVF